MTRVFLMLAAAVAAPRLAAAQVRQSPATDAPAATSAGVPASAPVPPAGGDASTTPSGVGVPAPSEANPAAPPTGAPSTEAEKKTSAAPQAGATPGDQYYVDGPARGPGSAPERPFEPPVPREVVYEPPPPPVPRHVAPRMALWTGARLGWFYPFGNVWADALPTTGNYYVLEGRPWRDFASSGPMFEIDLGARLSRAYTLFALWERAQLGGGRDERDGEQDRAESDFWAIALRASSNPDQLGFVTEVAIGYRRARTLFENGSEYQFTDAPFEARLGLGAEYRVSRHLSLSPLVTIGVGGFGRAESVAPKGNVTSLTSPNDHGDGHAWLTLQIGAHFDLFASRD